MSNYVRPDDILKDSFAVEGYWGIRKGPRNDGTWFTGPPEYVITHGCPKLIKAETTWLEKWVMKTMHWKCPGCGTAPSERIVLYWKLMAGPSLVWEDPIPEGTDLTDLTKFPPRYRQ